MFLKSSNFIFLAKNHKKENPAIQPEDLSEELQSVKSFYRKEFQRFKGINCPVGYALFRRTPQNSKFNKKTRTVRKERIPELYESFDSV